MYMKLLIAILIGFFLLEAPLGCRSDRRREKARRADSDNEVVIAVNAKNQKTMPPLNDAEKQIIIAKGTERPFTGKYWNHFEQGAYLCRQCGSKLYRSGSKFRSDCGWPSFDDEIPAAVKRLTDADGRRTEILCASCDGHLGHVFAGEQLTEKNIRHCVNSASLIFEPTVAKASAQAIFAGGCFWGVEHHMEQIDGVASVVSGYIGGDVADPTSRQVASGKTGHAEAVRVVYDPKKVTYEVIARKFFEIHDPTQLNRQGPGIGDEYRSAVFFLDERQKATAEKLIAQLRTNGYDVVTKVEKASRFYAAEDYHQDYLVKHPGRYICHKPVARFDKPKE